MKVPSQSPKISHRKLGCQKLSKMQRVDQRRSAHSLRGVFEALSPKQGPDSSPGGILVEHWTTASLDCFQLLSCTLQRGKALSKALSASRRLRRSTKISTSSGSSAAHASNAARLAILGPTVRSHQQSRASQL